MLQSAYRFSGLKQTRVWGERLGALLVAGDVVALIGDLGAGKTTLTQAIARGMNIVAPVTSPTFALAQEYPGRLPLFHFDPYRLDSPEAFADIGFEEYFERGGVVVVEWADKITGLLPEERLTLTLDHSEETDEGENAGRTLAARAVGQRYVTLLAKLNAYVDIAPLVRAAG
jgi:tRNA threonylcarbamoyladenosine biosynthesis protein TsaE